MAKPSKQRSIPKPLSARALKRLDASGTVRLDGWQNFSTGHGVFGKDKRLGGDVTVCTLSQEQNEAVWRADAIAARMVETVPREILREGYCSVTPDDPEQGEELDARVRELGVLKKMETGMRYGKALGGGALLLGIDDGQSPEMPLKEESIRSFKWLNALTPRELQAVKWYSDPFGPKYGEVSQYRVVPYDPPPDQRLFDMKIVHESRLVRFDGVVTSRGARLRNEAQPGWDDSIFVRSLQTVKDFQHAHQGLAALLMDFATPVLKIKGLAKLLATSKPGDTTLMQRANALELCRSIMRVAIVDSEEDFKRDTTNTTGLGDLLEHLALWLAAEAGMPVSLLMGQAPAGLNATGDSDIRWFYDQVRAQQRSEAEPPLKRILTLLALDRSGPLKGKVPDNWAIKWHPLYQLTQLEQADVRLKVAQADSSNITAGVVTPEEVAESRFGGDEFSLETQLDSQARDAYASADLEQAPATPPIHGQPAVPALPGVPARPGASAAEGEKAQDTALNGAQVTSALEIVKAVAQEELPRDSGVNMLQGFFNLSPEDAESIMGTVGNGFKPKPPEPVELPPGAAPVPGQKGPPKKEMP